MKVIGIRQLREATTEYIAESQDDRVIITRHGKPVAVLTGVEGADLEDVLTGSDPEIAARIQRQRKRKRRTLSHAVFWKRAGL